MKKIKTLLILSGLMVATLAGCDNNSTPSSNSSTSEPSSAISSSSTSEASTSESSSSESSSSSSAPIVKAIESIRIASLPTKRNYFVGQEIDQSGLQVKAVYNTGEEEDIPASEYDIFDYDSMMVGEQTVAVVYGDFEATFKVTVEAIALASVAITSGPQKTEYFVGDDLDLSGIEIKAIFNNGDEFALTPRQCKFSGFDSVEPGEKTVTVVYGEKQARFTVNVNPVALIGIRVDEQPDVVSYYVGEEFNAAGLKVNGVFNNGSEEELQADAYQLSGFDSSKAGMQEITVNYQTFNTSFNVTVIGEDGIVISAPNKTIYGVGDEFDPTGIKVSKKYQDGTLVEIENAEYQVEGFDSSTEGEKTITVTYGEVVSSQKVFVSSKTDWTDEEKALMNIENENALLVYELPYYLGLEMGIGGLVSPEDPNEAVVEWVEARTNCEASVAILKEYKAMIEGIKTSKDEQAWARFEVAGGNSRYTDDLDYLGFDEYSNVYQYARWYNDNTQSPYYQVLSIGLDPDGKLLLVSTMCCLGYAGYGLDGGGFYAMGYETSGNKYDMVEELGGIIDERAQDTFEDADTFGCGFMDGIKFPVYDENSVVFFSSKQHDSPYIGTNMYSAFYDGASCELELSNDYGDNPSYNENNVKALVKTLEVNNGLTFVEDKESHLTTAYVTSFTYNYFDLTVSYRFSDGYIIVDITVDGFDIPFASDFYLDVYTKGMVKAAGTSATFNEVADSYSYNEVANVASKSYSLGSAETSSGAVNGIVGSDRDIAINGIKRATGLSGVNVDDLEWNTIDAYSAGQAKVNKETATQYLLDSNDSNKLSFVSGDNSYVAVYDPDEGTLTVAITSVSNPDDPGSVVVFTAEQFKAASGSNNDPFAGTWNNGELKITLGKSSSKVLEQSLTFNAFEKDGKTMQYTVLLKVVYNETTGHYEKICTVTCACVDAPEPAPEQGNEDPAPEQGGDQGGEQNPGQD